MFRLRIGEPSVHTPPEAISTAQSLPCTRLSPHHAERAVLAHDVIHIRLQVGWNVVVAKRRADSNVIRSQQLVHEFVGEDQYLMRSC